MLFEKKYFIINGAERLIIYDKEKDTMADVLRRNGFTGVKVGCGKGVCGACSVIINGELKRSCIVKAAKVEEYSEIITVEGLGNPNNMHPIQQAFVYCAAIQCGFCTPGFIMSTYALLKENPDPTRQEVREWFQKHKNVCRCTGYKQIVDAVIAAAAVMRGEKTMDDITYKVPEDGKVYGTGLPRPDGPKKATGLMDYGEDIALKMPPGTLYGALVLGKANHALIKNLDISEAEATEGVFKVVTAKDVLAIGTNRYSHPMNLARSACDGFEQEFIAEKKIKRYGDVVAVVLAHDYRTAREAAEKVKLDLELLPEYATGVEAVAEDAVEINEGVPNLFMSGPLFKGKDTRDAFEESKYIVEGSFSSTREPHLSIETDPCQAYPDGKGGVVVHCKSLSIHGMKGEIAAGIGLQPEQVRVVLNGVGGSFGYTCSCAPYGLVAACAMVVNRPVALQENYEEFLHYTGKRAAGFVNGRLGCDENGKLNAFECDMMYDKGAYAEQWPYLYIAGLRFAGAPYTIPNEAMLARGAFSNRAYSTAYRSFGSPQVACCTENLMEMLAEKVGMDQWEFRYQNVYRPGDTENFGIPLKTYPMPGLFEAIKPVYDRLKKHAEEATNDKFAYGVGLASGGFNVSSGPDYSEVDLSLDKDGKFTIYNCWEELGQGATNGTLAEAHEALRKYFPDIKLEDIRMVMNDTGLAPATGPAAGSRAHFVAGNATIDAARQLTDAMRKEDGTYRTYEEMEAEGIPTRYTGVFSTIDICDMPNENDAGCKNPTSDHSYVLFCTEVEVNKETGKARVIEMHAAYDIGVLGTPQDVEGQAYGGISHSIGFALTDDYSDMKKHTNMVACGIPYIMDIPDGDQYTAINTVTERENGPWGSGGCSEAFQSSGHAAVINAIYQATGVWIYNLPATPDKIKKAMEDKAAGIDNTPEPYFMGSDFYDEIDYIKENPV